MLRPCRYSLSPVAATGEEFVGFAPYVPAIDSSGAVAFQAALRGGGSGVYAARAGRIDPIAGPGVLLREVLSHPAINAAGACCFYGATRSGERAVFAAAGGEVSAVAPRAGPLGPTMNSAGAAAFRAETSRAGQGVFRADGGSVALIAETGERYSAFHGLPVIDGRGRVLFRADRADGVQAVVLGDGDTSTTLAETGERFAAIGFFPAMNDAGVVAFCASLRTGGPGVFVWADGKISTLIDGRGPFESFRGALVDAGGRVVFYATPRAGSLGVFSGPDPERDRVLAIGVRLLGSTVAEFALNPVSINGAGRLAIRVGLTDGRQFIVRADPSRAG